MERSANRLLSSVPDTLTPPRTTLATRPLSSREISPTQPDASPVKSASGCAERSVSRKSSSVQSTRLTKLGTSSSVSGLLTLMRYGRSLHMLPLASVAPADDEWNAANTASPS